MIKLMTGLPDNVLGFEAIEKVSGKDYDTILIPAVEAKIKDFPKIHLLYVLGPEFIGYDMEAMWDDTKIGLKHLRAWEKIAVVTDTEWIRKAVHMFGFTIPGQVSVYKNDELSNAKDWVSE